MSRESAPTESPQALNWTTTLFLCLTLVVALVTTPLYILRFGFGAFEASIFLAMFALTGLSITVGYHRLFTHRAFDAAWPVRLGLALFGAGAFEGSALAWCSDHRYHHKYTDQDGNPHDPHSIRKGFFWAHMGWLLVHDTSALAKDNVPDLERDPILRWQHRWFVPIGIFMGFLLPMIVGGAVAPWLGRPVVEGLLAGFIFGGCTRIVLVQHGTFLINSAAHMFGSRPYDSSASSRDNALLAFFTFGEGYHNFHHAFQTDYRNGVRWYQFDPSKWTIWILSRLGLASRLRRTPSETIRLARIRERRRQLEERLAAHGHGLEHAMHERLQELEQALEQLHLRVRVLMNESAKLGKEGFDRQRARFLELRQEMRQARREFRRTAREWWAGYQDLMRTLPEPA